VSYQTCEVPIIAILAAILFPIFAQARDKARQAACQSNMKQMALALQMYAQDYDEVMPPNFGDVSDFANPDRATRKRGIPDPVWRTNYLWCLHLYTKSHQILACPSVGTAFPGIEPTPNSSASYLGNGVIMGRSLAAIPAPADIVFLQEFRWLTHVAWLRPDCISPTSCYDWCWWAHDGRPGYSFHHQEGGNLIYMDGHAKYRKATALRSGDFALSPPDDRVESSGTGHSSVCGKRYARQF
jgi:type II secretory pathway pseudopilin PulG